MLHHDIVKNLFVRFKAVVNWDTALKESVETRKVLKVLTVKLFTKQNVMNKSKTTNAVLCK